MLINSNGNDKQISMLKYLRQSIYWKSILATAMQVDYQSIEELKKLIASNLNMLFRKVQLLIPYTDTAAVAKVHALADVVSTEYLEQGVSMTVNIAEEKLSSVNKYLSE